MPGSVKAVPKSSAMFRVSIRMESACRESVCKKGVMTVMKAIQVTNVATLVKTR